MRCVCHERPSSLACPSLRKQPSRPVHAPRPSHALPSCVPPTPPSPPRVYYYWALQQEATGYVGEDGKYHPPRWQLREMLIRGMHHLL